VTIDDCLDSVPEDVRDCINAVCERAGTYDADFSVLKAAGEMLAASPSWQDRPTGAGLWFQSAAYNWTIDDQAMQSPWVEAWLMGRVYGPIPADTQGEK
jgi:hypothetical protein